MNCITMGLDSVELIQEIETYFRIRIPDTEAEKIYTVQDIADAVCLRRQVIPAISPAVGMKDEIFSKVYHYFKMIIPLDEPLTMSSKIAPLLPTSDNQHWSLLQEAIALDLPKPDLFTSKAARVKDKIKKWLEWQPTYIWESVRLSEFIDAIYARNYKSLLNPHAPLSAYDIYIAIVAITVEKTGVDYYDISPGKSFTDDFGID